MVVKLLINELRLLKNSVLYKLVAIHYLFAAFTFLVLAPMLLFSITNFGGHYFQPHLLAITHTVALGWATVNIFGVCYQLLPVIVDSKLYSYKLAWFGFVSFCLGLIDFVYSLWVFEPGLHMQCGSLLLLIGISSFTAHIFLSSKEIKTPDISQDFILTACIWLLVTAILGVLMVFNFRYVFLSKDHLLYLKLHAHAGFGGWFLLLVIGFSAKLIQKAFAVKMNTSLLHWSFYLINAAILAFFINTYVFGINYLTFFISSMALAGIFCWLAFVFRYFGNRVFTNLKTFSANSFLAILLLLLAVALLPFIIFYQLKADLLAVRLTTLYGTLLLFGWITSLNLRQIFKIIPLIYKSSQSPDSVGFDQNLWALKPYTNYKLRILFFVYGLFMMAFSAGLILDSKLLLYFGVACFALTAILYAGNVFIALSEVKKQAGAAIDESNNNF